MVLMGFRYAVAEVLFEFFFCWFYIYFFLFFSFLYFTKENVSGSL